MRRYYVHFLAISMLVFTTSVYSNDKYVDDKVLVYAASSMTTALNNIAEIYKEETGRSVTISYAASSALARQLTYGAPADIYISANDKWMNYVVEQGVIDTSTLVSWVKNKLVVVGEKNQHDSLQLTADNMIKAIGTGRIAIGDPGHVPAGIYTKEALINLNVWDELQGKLAYSNSVRATLALVERREAPIGIVYRSDALASSSVHVVAEIPDDTYSPIIFPKAMTYEASKSAVMFFEYLASDTASRILTENGFVVIDAVRENLNPCC